MSMTLSGSGKPKRKFQANYPPIYVQQTAAFDFKRIKIRLGKARLGWVYLSARRVRCSCCPPSLGPIASAATLASPLFRPFLITSAIRRRPQASSRNSDPSTPRPIAGTADPASSCLPE